MRFITIIHTIKSNFGVTTSLHFEKTSLYLTNILLFMLAHTNILYIYKYIYISIYTKYIEMSTGTVFTYIYPLFAALEL